MSDTYMPIIHISAIKIEDIKIHESLNVKEQLSKVVNREDLERYRQESKIYMGTARGYLWILPSTTGKQTNCQKSAKVTGSLLTYT